ncbi:hypothetical protein BH11BAC5_BH11BAC5_08500 [soil metagenome]
MSDEKEHKHFDSHKLISDIKQFGLTVLLMPASDYLPSFAYTVGLWETYKHPELISFGLTTKTLHLILNDAGAMIKSGEKFNIGQTYHCFFKKSKTEFIQVDYENIRDYFGNAINFYESKDFPALQLVWTDRANNFPWEKDYEEEFKYRQPLLDRNANFKFREAQNLATFTTRQWLELHKPILRVIHDSEGDWQFLTGDQMPEDIKIVALEQIILKDKTLNDVFNLDYGESAEREFVGGKWTREKMVDSSE